jgi:hypothetical protein
MITQASILAEEYQAAIEKRRPFIQLRPNIFIDGEKWCVLYGQNLQDGVAGFGDTPEQAAINFDIAWLNERTPAARAKMIQSGQNPANPENRGDNADDI